MKKTVDGARKVVFRYMGKLDRTLALYRMLIHHMESPDAGIPEKSIKAAAAGERDADEQQG